MPLGASPLPNDLRNSVAGRHAISLAMVGELVAGRYRVTRHIAEGGMGVVCEAIHLATGRHVALKIVRNVAALGEDRDAWLTRFRREARAVGSLDSRHVTQIFDAGTDEASGQPFIAMELLAGADLAQVLKHIGPLPPVTALKIVGQACLALERAHAAGIVHRDIKPANVFLSASESDEITVKLVDFGVAKIMPEMGEAELTQTGSILGTPTYMSPEQAKGTRRVDHRADLWALAVVLYKALTGRVPHSKRDGLGELILTICTKPAPAVQDQAPWVSPEVAHLLDRALQLEIDRRYQSATEFRRQIESLLPDGLRLRRSGIRPLTYGERCQRAPRLVSTFPPSASDPTPSATGGANPKTSRWWLPIGVAAALFAVATTAVIAHIESDRSSAASVLSNGAMLSAAKCTQTPVARLTQAERRLRAEKAASDEETRRVPIPRVIGRESRAKPAASPTTVAPPPLATVPLSNVSLVRDFE